MSVILESNTMNVPTTKSSLILFSALSTKLTERSVCSTRPHLGCTEGALRGGRLGLVPGRDLLLTWLQLNYSRQLDGDLPSETTLLAADLVPTVTATAETYPRAPSASPDPPSPRISTEWRRVSLLRRPWLVLQLLLVLVVYCRCLEKLTFQR